MSRREFLRLSALAGAATAGAGCAVNPVSGKYEPMLVPAQQDVSMDRQGAPRQFSADYGAVSDAALNGYVGSVGRKLTAHVQRRDLPYSFRVVNAVYANAYTFPGGSVAVTRGLLIDVADEAQLAALLGHELAHVNWRHTAQSITRAQLTQLALTGVTAYVGAEHEKYARLASGLGNLGGTLLLASYSREHERQADDTGMDYMVKAGYDPRGMVDLMTLLMSMSRSEPDRIQVLFSTHPVSRERHDAMARRATMAYGSFTTGARNAEALQQATAGLRAAAPAIRLFSKGEQALARQRPADAQVAIEEGLRLLPEDYAGLLLMAKCMQALNRPAEALAYAQRAKATHPGEPQAETVLAEARFGLRQYDLALEHLRQFDRLLPGNPAVAFYAGLCYENLGSLPQAAGAYRVFLDNTAGAVDPRAWQVQHAALRLNQWYPPRPAPPPPPRGRRR
jgi:predicted Zn-dependent protease